MRRITLNHLHSHQLEMMQALQQIGKEILIIKKQNRKNMATLAEVKQALADLQTSVDANQEKVIARIQDLKDQIAQGGTVTEADLDELVVAIKATQTDVDETDEG